MVIVKVCGAAVIGVFAYTVLSNLRSGVNFAVKLAVTVLMSACALSVISPIPEKISALAQASGIGSKYVSALIRAVGIAMLGQLTSDVCRDCGDNSSANGVELVAKLEIVLICLPLIEEITECAFRIFKLG